MNSFQLLDLKVNNLEKTSKNTLIRTIPAPVGTLKTKDKKKPKIKLTVEKIAQ